MTNPTYVCYNISISLNLSLIQTKNLKKQTKKLKKQTKKIKNKIYKLSLEDKDGTYCWCGFTK